MSAILCFYDKKATTLTLPHVFFYRFMIQISVGQEVNFPWAMTRWLPQISCFSRLQCRLSFFLAFSSGPWPLHLPLQHPCIPPFCFTSLDKTSARFPLKVIISIGGATAETKHNMSFFTRPPLNKSLFDEQPSLFIPWKAIFPLDSVIRPVNNWA